MTSATTNDFDREYTRIFTRITRGWSAIYSFRTVAGAGMSHAAEVVAGQHQQFMDEFVSTGKMEKFIIGIVGSAELQKTADFIRQKLTEQTLTNASNSVDAASLVFAHTVLDDALNSFLGLTSKVARGYWEGRLRALPVPVAPRSGHLHPI